MYIGLDFDGVLAGAGPVKARGVRELFGITIAPDMCKTRILKERGLLTPLQYYRAIDEYLFHPEIGMTVEPVPGAVDYTHRLLSGGHRVAVVTSRSPGGCDIARRWLGERDLDVPVIGVGYSTPKTKACTGMDAYVDDDPEKLRPVAGVVKRAFLFSWLHNRELNDAGLIRVESWEELYAKLLNITSPSIPPPR